MGTLKEGATYIYERDKGVVYAREFGSAEKFVKEYSTKTSDETITISMDAGGNWS